MGSKEGTLKVAAKRIGIPFHEYKKRIASGEKWCHGCKDWHFINCFGKDASRSDGTSATCKKYRKKIYQETYILIPKEKRKKPGPKRIPRRDGDKLQARARINSDVDYGIRPDPNELPCSDCGHFGDDKRHEYDHYLGYKAEHHYDVEVTCSSCHHRRASDRGETWYSKGR